MAVRHNRAERLRRAVDCLPPETKRAMLDGVEANPIIVGAYTDGRGGVCPMLAAHRRGGRTSLASFARAWDAYTNARRARRASRREVRTLTAMLESSLARDEFGDDDLARAVAEITAAKQAHAARAAQLPPAMRPPEVAPMPRRMRKWLRRGADRRAAVPV